MNINLIHENHFLYLLNKIRTDFIAVLYNETVQAVKSGDTSLILNNWCIEDAKTVWMPGCETCGAENYCAWLKVYTWRYDKTMKDVAIKLRENECPVRNIRNFLLLEKDEDGSLSENAQNGLYLLLDFFNLWLWLVDEINGTLRIVSSSPSLSSGRDLEGFKSLQGLGATATFLSNLKVPVGKGSTGYALSLKKGICMNDAVTDLRRTAVFRNIVSRRFSYAGVPVKDRDRVIAYISLSYPVLHAWHPSHASCVRIVCKNNSKNQKSDFSQNTCFYKKFEEFLLSGQKSDFFRKSDFLLNESSDDNVSEKGYYHSIKYGCKSLLKDRLYEKLFKATKVSGSKPDFHDLLKNFCASEDAAYDALGISYASLWEGNKEGDFTLREEVIAPEIVFAHITRHTIYKNRYKQQDMFFQKDFRVNTDENVKKIRMEIKDKCSGQDGVVFEITFKGSLNHRDREHTENILKKSSESLYDIFRAMERIMDISTRIYTESYISSAFVSHDKVEILRRKLSRDLCKIFVKTWCAEDISGYDDFWAAYDDFKFHVCPHWEKTGYLAAGEKEDVLSLMEKHTRTLMNQVKAVLADSENTAIHIWLNLASLFQNGFRIMFQLPQNKGYTPFMLAECKNKRHRIKRNLFYHSSFKPLDYMINFKKQGELTDISEDEEIISGKWSGVFSDFDYFSFAEFGDGNHRCGLLYKGTRQDAETFYLRLKEIIEKHESDPGRWDEMMRFLRDDDELKNEKNPYLLFHVKKYLPWYYIYVPEKQKKDKIVSPVGNNDKIKDILKLLCPILRKINRKKIAHSDGMPLFFWDIYGNEGKGSWKILWKN